MTLTTTTSRGGSTLVYPHEAVRSHAERDGDRPALTFVDYRRGPDGRRREEVSTMTYAELDARARGLAAVLRRRTGDRRDVRVAILCPHDASYPVAVLGCLYAGAVAVPLYPPELMRDHDRLSAALADSGPEVVLATRATAKAVDLVLDPGTDIVHVDEVPPAAEHGRRQPSPSAGTLAYLQYTSGSTGRPSGVRITHRNLAVAVHQVRTHHEPRVTVSWVPFFHDFGLVCGLLTPLAAGAHTVHVSPLSFIQDPYRWLEAVSRYRSDWTVAPNFTLDMCVRRIDPARRATLDLSALRLLTIAAEPVQAADVDAFLAAFGPSGLSPGAPTPCYGLAEATLPVTASALGQGTVDLSFDRQALAAGRVVPAAPGGGLRLVSCGVASVGVELRIVDPVTRCPTGDGAADGVGEIWVRGGNVADGYWNRPDRTAEVFDGELSDGSRGWLRTGDLGFLHDGHLFVTGRLKDIVIVRGRNHYPQDIEATVLAAAPPGDWGAAAAFGVLTGATERLVVVVEADRAVLAAAPEERHDVVAAIRQDVGHAHGIEVHDLVFTRRGALPRTTSGKLRRGECRERYLRGGFPA